MLQHLHWARIASAAAILMAGSGIAHADILASSPAPALPGQTHVRCEIFNASEFFRIPLQFRRIFRVDGAPYPLNVDTCNRELAPKTGCVFEAAIGPVGRAICQTAALQSPSLRGTISVLARTGDVIGYRVLYTGDMR